MTAHETSAVLLTFADMVCPRGESKLFGPDPKERVWIEIGLALNFPLKDQLSQVMTYMYDLI